jgi:DNA-binding NarL/FixJ family response regulator
LKAMANTPAVVIFSAYAGDHLNANCAVAGVDALLSKSSLGDELCAAIRAVSRGRRLLTRVPQPMADLLRRRLDESEQLAYGMLLAGIPADEIELALKLTPQQLATQRARMLAKLDALPGFEATMQV